MGRDVKSQTFSVFRNRRYKHLPEHLFCFVTRRWRGGFQVFFILYFSLIGNTFLMSTTSGIYSGNLLENNSWIWVSGSCAFSPSLPGVYSELSKAFSSIKMKPQSLAGLRFLSVPTGMCKCRFHYWLPAKKPSQGKNLYRLNLLPFITSFVPIPSPHNFLSF